MSFCKLCGEEIDFIRVKDKVVPVNPEPVFVMEGGGEERFLTDEGEELMGRAAADDEVETKEQKFSTPLGFVPHRRVCRAMQGQYWR